MSHSFSLQTLAEFLGATLVGDPEQEIKALATLQKAELSELSFIANPAYRKFLSSTRAGALLINEALVDQFAGNKLIVKNPYVAFARLTALFDNAPAAAPGIHPSAVIGVDCVFGEAVSIGANAVIGNGVHLDSGVVIGPGCYLGDHSQIGARSRLAANVSVYHSITIGADCMLHSGCVIGADGFGFAPDTSGWVKIHQLGSVIIGDRVEIGACTCIDRGALDNTYIGDGVIIDNQVQIAHNVTIGKNTAIAAHAAIAGSTTIGESCTISGAVAIAGHLTLADKVHITGKSLVSASIREAGSYSSGTPLAPTKDWRKNAARFRQLDSLATRLIKLERTKSAE